MAKKRNTEKKKLKAELKRVKKTRAKKIIICSIVVVFLLIAVILVFCNMDREVIFKNVNGEYIDPRTKITYIEATPFVYEPKEVYDGEGDVYGKMDGDDVFEVKGVSSSQAICRRIADGIYVLCVEKNVSLPTLSDFEANKVYVCKDDVMVTAVAISDEAEIVSALTNEIVSGTPVSKPEGINNRYTIRFESEKYPYFYMCVQLVQSDDGDFYMDLESNEYYEASDIVSKLLETDND